MAITGTGNSEVLEGTELDDLIEGLGGDDTLRGQDGDDTLDGGEGADTMEGGSGNDTYIIDDTGDVVTELDGEGRDTVIAYLDYYTLADYVEDLIAYSGSEASYTGNTLSNDMTAYITADSAVLSLNGLDGNDSLAALLDEAATSGVANLYGGAGNDSLRGMAATAGTATNNLYGGDGNDTIFGGSGGDVTNMLAGGLGDDNYHITYATDQIVENVDEGIDTIHTALDEYTLPDNVENLRVINLGSFNVFTGNGLANGFAFREQASSQAEQYVIVEAGDGDNTADFSTLTSDETNYWWLFYQGGAGADTVYGADGAVNEMQGFGGNDVLIAGVTDRYTNLQGFEGDDELYGYGSDYVGLDGGEGADLMDASGSSGHVRFTIDNISDQIVLGTGWNEAYLYLIDYVTPEGLDEVLLGRFRQRGRQHLSRRRRQWRRLGRLHHPPLRGGRPDRGRFRALAVIPSKS